MKRPRKRMAALGIFAILGSCFMPHSLGEEAAADGSESAVSYPAKQFISQECAPRRRRGPTVKVLEVDFSCDSQGDDDALAYTDVPTCKAGDLAKTAISFEIEEWSQNSSGDLYIDLNSTALGRIQRIYRNMSICNMNNNAAYLGGEAYGDDLYSQAKTTACPIRNGLYTFFTTFTIPPYSKDYDLDFTPDIRIEFFDEDRRLIGCVETGTLAELSSKKGKERQGRQLFIMSIVLLFLLSFIFLMGHRRKRKRGELDKRKKQASMLRRFHYIQTSRSGEIGINPAMSPAFSTSSVASSLSGARSSAVVPSVY